MNPWDFTLNFKDMVLDLTYLSTFLIIGTVLRRYCKFFQKYLIPNNIIAGFLGFILGGSIIGLIDLDSERLGMYVYHLLALTFVALGLRQEKTHWGKGPLSKSLATLSCYIVQGLSGLIVAFILVYTIKPDLFVGIGLLAPLGFGMGPGLAYAMGKSWEQFGFEGGGIVGITFAAIGYLFAYFGGIAFIHRGIRNRETKLIDGLEGITKDMRTGVVKESKPKIAGFLTLSSEAIEPLSFQLGLIGLVYLVNYWILVGLTTLMEKAGLGGFVTTVWSFHFVFALLASLAARKIIDITKRGYLIDPGLMNRISGVCVDYLVVGAICAISIPIIGKYWEAIVFTSILGAVGTYAILRYTSWRAFDDYHFERFIGMWGEMNGTLDSGLVLVKVTDPELSTPVAEDMVYGSGIALLLGIPLLILLNTPMNFFNNSLKGYWITAGLILLYLIILWVFWRLIGFIKFKKPESIS